MAENAQPMRLNLGCGFKRMIGFVNIDISEICQPDLCWDLTKTPLPFDSESVDEILAEHSFEHVPNWWELFKDCARMLKPGGTLTIAVPDKSSDLSISFKDHYHVFSVNSFHGIMLHFGQERGSGRNAEAKRLERTVPFDLIKYELVPHPEYYWIMRFPRILNFCSNHLRNFIWETRFTFNKLKKAGILL